MRRYTALIVGILCVLAGASAYANVGPVVDTFVAAPAVAAPGQTITLSVTAHDPDCAGSCTSGCGLYIASNYLAWSDNTGRGATAFQNSQPSASGSPWSATVAWIAPPVEGTFTVTASISDSGGMLCGGRKTTLASLAVTVTTAQPPVIDSVTITPASVPVGGSAQVAVAAHDPSGRALTYAFTADAGTISQTSPSSNTAQWTAPQVAGNVTLRVRVTAGGTSVDGQATASVQIGSYLNAMPLADTRATRIAALTDGRLAVVDGAAGTLQMTTQSGATLWRRSGLAAPVAVAIAGGELYVVERRAHRVSVWSTSGEQVRAFAVDGVPNAIASGPAAGELTLTDTAGSSVRVLSSLDGNVLRTIGAGTLSAPAGVAVSSGRIAVADAALGRVFLFNASGSLLRSIGDDTLLVRPQGVAWDAASARLVVSDSFSGELVIIGEDGIVRGTLGGFGEAAGQIVNPIDVSLLPGGVVAATTAGGRVPLFQLLQSLQAVAAPSNVVATDRVGDDGGAVALTWSTSVDDPSRVTAYVVQRSFGETADFQPLARLAPGSTTYVDASSIDGNCYHYQVAATDGVTTTPSPQTACASSRNDLAPPAPAAAQASSLSPHALTVSWAGVIATDLAGYRIDAGSVSLRVDRSTTTATIENLAADTEYTVAVRAIDSASNTSVPATATAKTFADAAPPAPVNVAVADAGTGGVVDVTWTEPESSVPVSSYQLTFTPDVAGWPVISASTSSTSAHVTGLVNRLAYSLTITASTAWSRESDASVPVAAMATRPTVALPLVAESAAADVGGLTVSAAFESHARELRFQYRTTGGAKLQLFVDGQPSGVVFADSLGVWADGSIVLDEQLLAARTPHVIELRNGSFPDPLAQLSLRRIDLVPLAPAALTATGMNSVVDVSWQFVDARPDLNVSIVRSSSAGETPVSCPAAHAASRCRDTFLTNGETYSYRFAIVSPAGWSSAVIDLSAQPLFTETPPPVTDVVATADGDGLRLDWTPLSTAATTAAASTAVPMYRVYRADASGLALLLETTMPSAFVPAGSFDPSRERLVVHSVDAQGRESQ